MYADLQVNGYKGVDFSAPDLSREDFVKAVNGLFEVETIFFLPTIITSPLHIYKRNIDLIFDTVEQQGWQKNIPGVHLEGPFISSENGAVGCHNPALVLDVDSMFLDTYGNFVKIMTVAAERPQICNFIQSAVKRGIKISLGHQQAPLTEIKKSIQSGAKLLTHLGNGIPNLIDRHNNVIWSGLSCDELSAMIITDGHHLPQEVIKCFFRCKGIEKIIVTSDASPGAGYAPGRYRLLGNDVILEKNGRLHNPVKNCLAGSAFTMRECINFLRKMDFLTEKELQVVGYHNAVKLLKS